MTQQTFVCLYGQSIFCAPNTEIYVCDMCEYRELPHRALSLYDKLLKPSADSVTDMPITPTVSLDEKPNFKKLSHL
jgi:hypothetical protein